MHRVAISQDYRDSLATILGEWSLGDVADANLVIDALAVASVPKTGM